MLVVLKHFPLAEHGVVHGGLSPEHLNGMMHELEGIDSVADIGVFVDHVLVEFIAIRDQHRLLFDQLLV